MTTLMYGVISLWSGISKTNYIRAVGGYIVVLVTVGMPSPHVKFFARNAIKRYLRISRKPKTVITPFTKDDIRKLLLICDHTVMGLHIDYLVVW